MPVDKILDIIEAYLLTIMITTMAVLTIGTAMNIIELIKGW